MTVEKVRARVVKILWVLFLLFLPVTSFSYFPSGMGGSTLVRPLSVYPLLALLVLATLPYLFTRPLPRTLLALFPFLFVATAGTIVALLYGIESMKGVSVMDRTVRALATLGLGSAIYITVVLLQRTDEDLRFSLRWLYAGFAIALAWGSLQAVYIVHFSQPWFDLLDKIQRYISIRKLFETRISGMTYEPNWFADQISFLLLPWLLASVISGHSVFRWRRRWLTVEWLLLIWAVAILPFTFSRAGLISFLALAFVAVLIRPRKMRPDNKSSPRNNIVLRRLFEGGLILVVLLGGIYLVGTKNTYFMRMWRYWQRDSEGDYAAYLAGYFEYIGFGARFTYWETAFHIFETKPVFGVGLGNYAFYFEEKLPDRPLLTTPEVLRLIVPERGHSRLITAKNFYLRILAETGLVGAATFMAFLAAIAGCVLYLWLYPCLEVRFWGLAGLLGLVAFSLVAFAFDSFAIPNMWVVFGLVAAAAHLHAPASSA